MLISIQELLGGEVISLETGNSVALIRQPIIDPKNGKVLAFDVRVGFITHRKIISQVDIVEWQRMALIIHHEDDLTDPEKVVRVNNLLKKKSRVLGKKAKTVSSQRLGRVVDLYVDTTSGMIVKYVIGHSIFFNFLEHGRILPASSVKKIDKKAVIFKDSVAKGKKDKAAKTETAAA